MVTQENKREIRKPGSEKRRKTERNLIKKLKEGKMEERKN